MPKLSRIVLGLVMLPAAALLMKKHAEVNVEGKKAKLYTFGKKGGPAKAVFVTNSTPAQAAKKAVSAALKRN